MYSEIQRTHNLQNNLFIAILSQQFYHTLQIQPFLNMKYLTV